MPSESQSPQTRYSLILRLRNRDDLQAWTDFVEVYHPLIHSLAVRRGLQSADADDVTQEVLTRVARSIDDWVPDPNRGSFRGWLATITRNQTVQCFRESSRRPTAGVDSQTVAELADPDGEKFTADEFDIEHERQLFAWAARKVQTRFEPRTWQAFWLTAVEQQPVEEVAEQIQMNRAQIYVARSRVMRQLKQTIEGTMFDSRHDWRVR